MGIPKKKQSLHSPAQTSGRFTGFVLPVTIAAVLYGLALMYVSFFAALLAFPLLMFSLLRITTKKQMLTAGLLFGALSSLLLNAWMITVVTSYVKGSAGMGLLCYVSSAVLLAVFFGMQFFMFGALRVAEQRKFSALSNTVLFTSLWVLFELARSYFFSAMPWLSYSVGITEAGNVLLIQPAAFGGVHVLSFLLLFSSCFIALALFHKRWKLLAIPAAVYAVQLTAGALLLSQAEEKPADEKFSAALILPAQSPETVWNDESAGTLVSHLFALNERATLAKPDLIVWTETVVPWTYAADDDFLQGVLAKTATAGTHTLIGMNTATDSTNEVLSNSIYFLDPAGMNVERYDKQDLLALVERPLFSEDGDLILPFLAASGMKMRSGKNAAPLQTPWGKAGLLVCNESTSPGLAHTLAKNGASFLVNMGNDSWFSEHFIPRQHFYNCRLRAVETRKDVIVNNNMGISGVVRASGEIAAEYNATKSGVQIVDVFPNTLTPVSPLFFTVFLFLLFIAATVHRFFNLNS